MILMKSFAPEISPTARYNFRQGACQKRKIKPNQALPIPEYFAICSPCFASRLDGNNYDGQIQNPVR